MERGGTAAGAPSGAAARVAAWRVHAAAVYGSGLWALPDGARVDDEVTYDELGWPSGSVPGHEYVLRLAAVPAAGRELRLALACGRPHRYEGWTDAELEAPVRDLHTAGVSRLVLTNSCGALRPEAEPGRAVVCSEVVDLQVPPDGEEPERLTVCGDADAARVAAALGRAAALPRAAVYVSVCGPQFETPAEVRWLSRYGAVVGMSAAPEARAAAATGVECCLLALVANVAAAVASHEDVLAAGGGLARLLAAGLVPAVLARWPGLLDT
jgi:purine-nucleoside phosphorylase